MEKNKKLIYAVFALCDMEMVPNGDKRKDIEDSIDSLLISPDDPWVAAALGCVNDADIPDVALEFFIADMKAGYYDMHDIEPVATP